MVNLLYRGLHDEHVQLLVIKRLNRQYTARERAMEVSSGSPCGRALSDAGWRLDKITAQYTEAFKEMGQNIEQTTYKTMLSTARQ